MDAIDIAAEAIEARNAGNSHGFRQCLAQLDDLHLSSARIACLLAQAEDNAAVQLGHGCGGGAPRLQPAA